MALRLWFNQAYRGTYQLIGMLRQAGGRDGLDLHVTGSHTAVSTPFLQACDTAFPEPEDLVGEQWVEFALRTCRERDIDVYVPGREREAVDEAADRFAAAGVKLMVSPAAAVRTLGDKGLAHESALALGLPVARTIVVTDAAGFRAAYETLRGEGLRVCMKPAVDHGAKGFRILDDAVGSWADLQEVPGPHIHPDDVERRIVAQGTVAPLLVTEYLAGDEISIDTLSHEGDLLAAVPRSKGGPEWTRTLVDDVDALEIAATVSKGYGLRYLSNVQVRRGADGAARLLEVNTRAASGLFQSAASGLNLPYLALRLLLDGRVEVPAPRLGATVISYNEAFEAVLPW